MTKLYLTLAICGLFFGAYLYGLNIGKTKCKTQIATQTLEDYQNQTKQRNKINAEIYHTSMRDIRDILRAKYTISD